MKNLILCLLLVCFFSTGHSQILLKEAKVNYQPESMKIDQNSSSLVVTIPEKIAGQFQKDPLEFMKTQFDIQKLVTDNKKENYRSYLINFKSKKGYLAAKFNRKGDLVSSHQKFRNIKLPESARLQILEKHRDAAILGNKYYASTKGWNVHKSYYKVKINDGKKIRRVRIDKDRGQYTLVGI